MKAKLLRARLEKLRTGPIDVLKDHERRIKQSERAGGESATETVRIVSAGGGSSGGVTDHGALTGLTDADHPHSAISTTNMKSTISLMAAAGAPTTTGGCADVTKVEAGTNDIDYWVLDFDAATQEHAFWNVAMPDNYDAGTFTAQFIWTTAASSGNVIWGIAMLSAGDSDAIDTAYGTAIEVTDGFLAAGDVHISSATSAITPNGTAAAGDMMFIRAYRKAADASDTLNGDARLIGVRLEYGVSAMST